MLTLQNALIKIKFYSEQNCHEKWTTHRDIVTSMLFKSLHHRLANVTCIMLSQSLYSPSVLFKRTNNFGSVE